MTAQLTEEETLAPVDASTKEHPNLAAALVAAQKEMPAVEKDATNPHFKSSFTSLGKLIATVRPVLNRNGIAVTQMPSQDDAGKPTLITRFVHTGGESMEETMPLILAKNDAQALGSALTYAKRYALAAALAIADQEDDDGNAATSGPEIATASEQQLGVLGSALNWLLPSETSATTWDAIKAQCGGEITGPVANALIVAIKARKDVDAPVEPEPAADPDPAPADGIEDEMPADKEGLS